MKKNKDIIFNKIDINIEMDEYDLFYINEKDIIMSNDNFPVVYIGEENRLMSSLKENNFNIEKEYTKRDILELEKYMLDSFFIADIKEIENDVESKKEVDVGTIDLEDAIISLTGNVVDSITSNAWYFNNIYNKYFKQNFEWEFNKTESIYSETDMFLVDDNFFIETDNPLSEVSTTLNDNDILEYDESIINDLREELVNAYLVDENFSADIGEYVDKGIKMDQDILSLYGVFNSDSNLGNEWEFSLRGLSSSKNIFKYKFHKKAKSIIFDWNFSKKKIVSNISNTIIIEDKIIESIEDNDIIDELILIEDKIIESIEEDDIIENAILIEDIIIESIKEDDIIENAILIEDIIIESIEEDDIIENAILIEDSIIELTEDDDIVENAILIGEDIIESSIGYSLNKNIEISEEQALYGHIESRSKDIFDWKFNKEFNVQYEEVDADNIFSDLEDILEDYDDLLDEDNYKVDNKSEEELEFILDAGIFINVDRVTEDFEEIKKSVTFSLDKDLINYYDKKDEDLEGYMFTLVEAKDRSEDSNNIKYDSNIENNSDTENDFDGEFIQSDLDEATRVFEENLENKNFMEDLNKDTHLEQLSNEDLVRLGDLLLFLNNTIDSMVEGDKDKFSKSEHYDSYIYFLDLFKNRDYP